MSSVAAAITSPATKATKQENSTMSLRSLRIHALPFAVRPPTGTPKGMAVRSRTQEPGKLAGVLIPPRPLEQVAQIRGKAVVVSGRILPSTRWRRPLNSFRSATRRSGRGCSTALYSAPRAIARLPATMAFGSAVMRFGLAGPVLPARAASDSYRLRCALTGARRLNTMCPLLL
jgi:hypothetical protein